MEGRKQSLSTKQRHTNRELLCSINVHVQTPIYSRFRQPLDFLPLAVSHRGFASPLARLADENRLPLLLQVSRKKNCNVEIEDLFDFYVRILSNSI